MYKDETFELFQCDYMVLQPFQIIIDENQYKELLVYLESTEKTITQSELITLAKKSFKIKNVDYSEYELINLYKYLSNWYKSICDVEDKIIKLEKNRYVIWGAGIYKILGGCNYGKNKKINPIKIRLKS